MASDAGESPFIPMNGIRLVYHRDYFNFETGWCIFFLNDHFFGGGTSVLVTQLWYELLCKKKIARL